MAIKVLMVDVDGVLIDGRPEDGRHWQTSSEKDFALTAAQLHEGFFAPHWEDIIVGRLGLMERLPAALALIAPHVSPSEFLSYWFDKNSRLSISLLHELALLRSEGIQVYLATNQEHLRASYLMAQLGLAERVDGIFYSAMLRTKKPEADFFTKVQAAVGFKCEEILSIDDSQQNVVAAQEVGWQTMRWTTDSSPAILRSLIANLNY
ncbi:HAD family hydrolase [Granulicella arctica]|uniref:HAD family hydrolase n=1 Tax=Granulicella arctica TaxID=940613 RepID=UPI0021E06231|nr:HAD-IA family hydrolase [Granulicella arctica]